jgi:hypothetical protein
MLGGMNYAAPRRQGVPLVPDRSALGQLALRSLARAGLAATHATLDGSKHADAIVRRVWPNDRFATQLVTRTASTPAQTTQAGWAAELGQPIVADMLAALAPSSAGAAVLAKCVPNNCAECSSGPV